MIPELPYKNLKGSPETKHRKRGPIIPAVGSLYNSNGSLPGVPSYSKIGNETIISDPDDCDIKHKIEITSDYKVLFNGSIIAVAPEPFTGKLKGKSQWTPARRLRFCKAVIWGIDPSYQGYVTKRVKNGNGQMEDQSFPDDLYFRELIAQYPAVTVEPIPVDPISPVEIVLPENLNAYTPEAITGYPLVKDNRDYELNRVEMVDLMEMNHTDGEIEEGYDYAEYDNVMTEFNLPAVSQMYDLIHPANIIRSWFVPHLRLTITEEVFV